MVCRQRAGKIGDDSVSLCLGCLGLLGYRLLGWLSIVSESGYRAYMDRFLSDVLLSLARQAHHRRIGYSGLDPEPEAQAVPRLLLALVTPALAFQFLCLLSYRYRYCCGSDCHRAGHLWVLCAALLNPLTHCLTLTLWFPLWPWYVFGCLLFLFICVISINCIW